MSPIPLGILAVAGAEAAGAYDLIQTSVLTSNALSVTFSSIPQDYKHLQIRANVRSTSTVGTEVTIRLNNDSGNNYRYQRLFGSGSGVTSLSSGSESSMLTPRHPESNESAGLFGGWVADILDYTATTHYTSVRTLGGYRGNNYSVWFNSGVWNNNAAVTSIRFENSGINMAAGSRFSLYGIRG